MNKKLAIALLAGVALAGTYTTSLKARIMSLTMGIRAYAKTLGD